MEKRKEEEARWGHKLTQKRFSRKQRLLELKPGDSLPDPTESKTSEFSLRQDGEDEAMC